MADNESNSPDLSDNEFGSPAPVNVEASETAAAIAAGVPLEDEDKDLMEEAYEATQREAESDIHGQEEEAEAVEEEEEYGQFNSREELLESYENLRSKVGELGLTPESYMKATGERANENQELRERLARLEGQAQATQAQAPPPRQQYDPRLQSRQMWANQRAQVYVDQGFGEEQARDIASKDAVALGMFVDAEITNRVKKYDEVMSANDREQHLQQSAQAMRDEKDKSGNLVRPQWDSVVSTSEFENQARTMGETFYTEQGLELAYLRTLPQVEASLAEQSSSAAAEAKANASDTKRRASVGPAATPASKTPSTKSSDDAEIEAIYETARAGKAAKNVFDGGAFD